MKKSLFIVCFLYILICPLEHTLTLCASVFGRQLREYLTTYAHRILTWSQMHSQRLVITPLCLCIIVWS